MKIQDYADLHAVELARHEGRTAPRNPQNFQAVFTRERDGLRQTFDTFVEGREYIDLEGMYSNRIFKPIDLGKFVVGRARPHLFAQLSVEERGEIGFMASGKVLNRMRTIRIFPETADTEPTVYDWRYVKPRVNNLNFIGGKLSLDDSRRRAIPGSVAMLREFGDTLGHIMAIADESKEE